MTNADALVALVRRAFDATEAGDAHGYLACLADDVIVEFPYASADGGVRLDKAGIGRMVGFLVKTFATRSFTIDHIYGTGDETAVVLEYHSEMRSRVGGVEYANTYVAIFESRDGLITLWREYANPAIFERVMAAIEAAASP